MWEQKYFIKILNLCRSQIFAEAMEVDFRQLELETAQHKVIVLVSKKGNISIKEKTKYVCADTAVQFTEMAQIRLLWTVRHCRQILHITAKKIIFSHRKNLCRFSGAWRADGARKSCSCKV